MVLGQHSEADPLKLPSYTYFNQSVQQRVIQIYCHLFGSSRQLQRSVFLPPPTHPLPQSSSDLALNFWVRLTFTQTHQVRCQKPDTEAHISEIAFLLHLFSGKPQIEEASNQNMACSLFTQHKQDPNLTCDAAMDPGTSDLVFF